MARYPCDNDDGNTAVVTVTSHEDASSVQFLCPACLSIMGIAIAKEMFPELLAEFTPPPTEVINLDAKPAAKRPSRKRVTVPAVETLPADDGVNLSDPVPGQEPLPVE